MDRVGRRGNVQQPEIRTGKYYPAGEAFKIGKLAFCRRFFYQRIKKVLLSQNFENHPKTKVTVWGVCNPAVSLWKGRLPPTTTMWENSGVWVSFTGFLPIRLLGGFLTKNWVGCFSNKLLLSMWRWTAGLMAGAVMRHGSARVEKIWNMKILAVAIFSK